MDQSSQASGEPPSACGEGIILALISGFNTVRYRALIDALAAGLAEYEARQHMQVSGGTHVTVGTPLPAA